MGRKALIRAAVLNPTALNVKGDFSRAKIRYATCAPLSAPRANHTARLYIPATTYNPAYKNILPPPSSALLCFGRASRALTLRAAAAGLATPPYHFAAQCALNGAVGGLAGREVDFCLCHRVAAWINVNF